ncbi:MAG TPA: DNA polymerase III subunit delta' [Oceanospirillales bacterium]|nr:DNA polymerase III subunit delta' [Oceanospirillales bacterium]
MNSFPWLEDHLRQWQQLVLANKVPHAMLLSGSKGLAKNALAKHMAHIALCENLTPSGVCGACKSCQLIAAGNHTDLTTVKAEKSVIKVDQIRALMQKVVLSSSRSHHRLIIIENAELMNKSSANALLKTLEEPPPNVLIILSCNDIGRMLATIKSRCVKINVTTPDHAMTQQWLNQQLSASEQEQQLSLLLANGAPLIAQSILENNILPTFSDMLLDLQILATNRNSVLAISKKWLTNECCLHLVLIASYFLSMLRLSELGEETSKSLQFFNPLRLTHVPDIAGKTLNFISQIHLFLKRMDTSLKAELLLEELLIGWQNEFIQK